MRIGIGLYGIGPVDGMGESVGLRPALTWRSSVSFVKRLQAGRRVSYGQRYELVRDAWVATVPVGYADGYPRMLSSRADVVIGGRRCRVAGSVTMDQLIVDCGDLRAVAGRRRRAARAPRAPRSVTAWELAGPVGHDRLRDRGAHRSPGAAPVHERGIVTRDGTRRTALIAGGVAAGAVAAGAVGRTVRRRRADHDLEAPLWDLPPDDLGPVRSFDGTKLAVRAAGDPDAPMLLFVHGFSLDMTTWREQWVDLSLDHRVRADGSARTRGQRAAASTATCPCGRWAATSLPCSKRWHPTVVW